MRRSFPTKRARAGLTLVELVISLTISAVILGMILTSMQQDVRSFEQRASVSAHERAARDMLLGIEKTLEFAQGATPSSFVSAPAGSTAESLQVADPRGFPDLGTLLVAPGTAAEERMDYDSLDPLTRTFRGLERGVQCGAGRSHRVGESVLWSGLAVPIENQTAPAPELFEGASLELTGPVFYRGDGTGFSFRVPVADGPGGGFIDGGGVRWGATIDGRNLTAGWMCMYFEPVALIDEAERQRDLNADGDREDQFDLGRLRLRAFDASIEGGESTDLALCPPMILQERCAPGSDLDADGFQDPLFLWDADASRLRIRLFLMIGSVAGRELVQRVESVVFLRNGALQ